MALSEEASRRTVGRDVTGSISLADTSPFAVSRSCAAELAVSCGVEFRCMGVEESGELGCCPQPASNISHRTYRSRHGASRAVRMSNSAEDEGAGKRQIAELLVQTSVVPQRRIKPEVLGPVGFMLGDHLFAV
jgi:hypothetical protein